MIGKLGLILGSAFLPHLTQRLGEKGRRRRRRLKAKEYSKLKRKDMKKMTKQNMKSFFKYYPKVSKLMRAERDEAVSKVGQIYDDAQNKTPQHESLKKRRY